MNDHYLRGSSGRARLVAAARRLGLGGGALSLLLLALGAQAQQLPTAGFFADDASARQAAATSPLAAALSSARPLTLNVPGLRAALATAPLESQARGRALVVQLPLPNGTNASFRIVEAPVMEPGLAAQFPGIKTYVGVGVNDPNASVRLDLTPRGFHAQVLSPTTGTFYIDPATQSTTQQYLSFWKRDMPGRNFDCGVTEDGAKLRTAAAGAGSGLRTNGPVLRTYRLAMAATGEYTAFHSRGLPAGSTPAQQIAAAQAAIVTSVNRVVGVYEKELAVRLVLVAGNSQLVYADPATDPYTNSSGSTMLAQNQPNIDALIGAANYDVGHVFSTASGGVAGLGVVCRNGQKARGTTGTSSPIGDAFDIDYVAHELGHQFGGSHTFNGNAGSCAGGNRSAAYAYEPGSGTTIMAYAGICGAANNLQPNSDPYFHVASYEQILTYLGTTSCAVTTATGNTAPLVTLPASGKVLPISTPFKLTASAFDPDNDALSYCWEEYDLGPTGSPTTAQVANSNVPIFRTFNPTASNTRYFPRLTDLVNNTTVLGERLPTVTRELRFKVTVRDQNNGSQGIIGGVNSSDPVVLSSTSAAGPFLVLAPNATGISLAGGSSQAVTWDVAGTTANGVNCATVNIRLSVDGGLTYPTLLLAGTANDGTQSVTLPNVATTTARIMVEAADNYFFDISDNNFAITTATACAAPTSLVLTNITRTTASLSFGASGAASYSITTDPATTTQTVTGTTATLTGLTAGTTYMVYVQGNCGAAGLSAATAATFSTLAPPVCNPVTNVQLVNTTSTSATVSFTASTSGPADYTVTTSPATTTQTITASPLVLTGLATGTTYTVSIRSNCTSIGLTGTETLAFTTRPANDECATALPLTPGTTCVTTAGSVLGATESQPAGSCSGATSSSANDVWYSFVASGPTQAVTATSALDGVLEVFSGNCGSLSSLGCSDLFGGNSSETVALTGLVQGNTYYVRYFAYNGAAGTGAFTLCVLGLGDLVVSTPQAVSGNYFNVTVTGTGVATLSNNLTVYGAMIVQNGGSLSTSPAYYLQGVGSFALQAGATLIETNAAGIVNSNVGGFLFNVNTPTFSTDANYVYAGTAAQVTGALLPRNVRNLTVNNSAGVTLTNPVNVAQIARLQSGNLTLGTRRLLLRSTAAGTALVDNTGGVVNGTTAAMQRALTGGVTAGPAYRHFSSPVQAVAIDSLRTGGFVPVVNPAYNTSATPGAVQPYPTVFGYDESRLSTTTNNSPLFDKGWYSPASLGDALAVGKGYTVNLAANQVVDFVGTLNNGDYVQTLTRQNQTADGGWQLVGNPYPAPLDYSRVDATDRIGLDGAIYVNQSSGQYVGSYRSYVNGIGNSIIPMGQGFFARVTEGKTNATLALHNSQRVTDYAVQVGVLRTTGETRPVLNLTLGAANGSADALYVYAENGTTAGFDLKQDAAKLANATGLNLAALTSDGQPLSIQGLAALTGRVALRVQVPAAGTYSLSAAELLNLPAGTQPVLEDTKTGQRTPLTAAGSTYTFTVAAGEPTDGRFWLSLNGTTSPLPTTSPLQTEVALYPNPTREGQATLLVPTGTAAGQVQVLDALGRLVRQQALTVGGATTLKLAGLPAGVYMVRVQAGSEQVTRRLTIN